MKLAPLSSAALLLCDRASAVARCPRLLRSVVPPSHCATPAATHLCQAPTTAAAAAAVAMENIKKGRVLRDTLFGRSVAERASRRQNIGEDDADERLWDTALTGAGDCCACVCATVRCALSAYDPSPPPRRVRIGTAVLKSDVAAAAAAAASAAAAAGAGGVAAASIPSPAPPTEMVVVIKEYDKSLVEKKCTREGHPVHEDAKSELKLHAGLCREPSSQHIVKLYDLRADGQAQDKHREANPARGSSAVRGEQSEDGTRQQTCRGSQARLGRVAWMGECGT